MPHIILSGGSEEDAVAVRNALRLALAHWAGFVVVRLVHDSCGWQVVSGQAYPLMIGALPYGAAIPTAETTSWDCTHAIVAALRQANLPVAA